MTVVVYADDLEGIVAELERQELAQQVDVLASSLTIWIDRDRFAELELIVDAYGGGDAEIDVVEA